MTVLTDLLGRRVEAIVKTGWSHSAHNSDDQTNVIGAIRALNFDGAGYAMLIESEDGVLHTRVLSLTSVRLLPVEAGDTGIFEGDFLETVAYDAFLAGHARPVPADQVDEAFDRWWKEPPSP